IKCFGTKSRCLGTPKRRKNLYFEQKGKRHGTTLGAPRLLSALKISRCGSVRALSKSTAVLPKN
ncbi:hypothetical protein PanWU01x14_319100, partial [Parasponia andersonii]